MIFATGTPVAASGATGERRCSKLVFIGKNLDKAALEESFRECLANEEGRAKRARHLRFKIGDVSKNTAVKWSLLHCNFSFQQPFSCC